MTDITPPRLGRAGSSTYLKERHGIQRTPNTLAKLAVIGGGPKFRKIGKRQVAYDVPDLDEWASTILSEPLGSTSERSA